MADTIITNKTLQFELVSPERAFPSEAAVMVQAPAREGEIGVMAGHAPLLASLKPGVVVVHLPSGSVKKIFVSGGFVDVGGPVCSVLAEEAVNVEDLGPTAADHHLRQLQEAWAAEKDNPVRAAILERQIQVERERVSAAQRDSD